jgi:class 3 adenylate cyclase
MEAPPVQYAKTSDGVSIAFWSIGRGEPLVVTPPSMISHCELEWRIPAWRQWYERLAQGRMVIKYDRGGSGLSDRNVTDFSLEAALLEIDAVADSLGLRRFDLLGNYAGGFAGIRYATLHVDRVRRLILWSAFGALSDIPPGAMALAGVADKDWLYFTEAIAPSLLGWPEGKESREYAAFARECMTPELYMASIEAVREWDVSGDCPQVTCPTLVLHRRQVLVPPLEAARRLASMIPSARLVVLEGASREVYIGDSEAVARAIDEFLGAGQAAGPEPQPSAPGAVHTILFTDVEGSTAMTQRLGDTRAREVMREHERITRECLRAHGGSEVKTMGDGFMASFGSAVRALECAIAVQRAMADWNAGVGRSPSTGSGRTDQIHVRIGLNAGEPIAEDDPDGRGDLFGTAVIRAARIAALAQGGEILVANVVRELAEGKGFLFGDRGEVALRGFDDPVRLFEVRWQEDA